MAFLLIAVDRCTINLQQRLACRQLEDDGVGFAGEGCKSFSSRSRKVGSRAIITSAGAIGRRGCGAGGAYIALDGD